MTRTVESPRGGATLTITPGDNGIVYLRAVNEVSEVTVPLLPGDLLAAIDAELDVVVLDASGPRRAIEQQVREQVAREIEALDGSPLLKGLVGLSPSAQATIEYAAATARGER